MKNVLITGSNGFIGQTLIKEILKDPSVNIIEFNRVNTLRDLTDGIRVADIIFHLAGEVRPKSSHSDFMESNFGLTESIVDLIKQMNKATAIVFSSTIHALEPKNSYGESKKLAEELLAKYSNDTGANVWVYHLSHVFGPGCKPDHNSVISTWISNSIKKTEINVFDREIKINYCYSLHVAELFASHIGCINIKQGYSVMHPSVIYPVTLGYVADTIKAIGHNVKGFAATSDFEHKLYATYLDYYNDVR